MWWYLIDYGFGWYSWLNTCCCEAAVVIHCITVLLSYTIQYNTIFSMLRCGFHGVPGSSEFHEPSHTDTQSSTADSKAPDQPQLNTSDHGYDHAEPSVRLRYEFTHSRLDRLWLLLLRCVKDCHMLSNCVTSCVVVVAVAVAPSLTP